MGWKEWPGWKKGIFIGFIYCLFSLFYGILIFSMIIIRLLQDQTIIDILSFPIWPIGKISMFLSQNNLIDYGLSSSNPLIEIFTFFIPLVLSFLIIILIFALIGFIIEKIKSRNEN